jgi:hypothetical protein
VDGARSELAQMTGGLGFVSRRGIHPFVGSASGLYIQKENPVLTAAQRLHQLLEARRLRLRVPPVLNLCIHIRLRRHSLGQIVGAVLELCLG